MNEQFKPESIKSPEKSTDQPFKQMSAESKKTNTDKKIETTSSDFFKKDPKKEHVLYKTAGEKPVDVTLSNPYGPASFWPDYSKVRKLYLKGDKRPYIEVHNHPRGHEDFFQNDKGKESYGIWDHYYKLIPTQSTMPSFGDLFCFLRDDGIGSIAVYQHNHETNETEGIYFIRKTKKTPKSGIEFSKHAEKSSNPEDADNKLAEDDGKLFDEFYYKGTTQKILRDFNDKTRNIKDSEERQKLFDEVIKELHLQIKYVPADGYDYSPGVGFLKKEKPQ